MGRQKKNMKIAVIGMAVNLPGAENIRMFWSNLCSGIDSTGKFPVSRIRDLQKYAEISGITESDYKDGGYLNDIASFDYQYFKMPKIEAILSQPAQRLFLENAVQAMEDAGYGGDKWRGKNIGVYVGNIGLMDLTGYQNITKKLNQTISPTGILSSSIAGRLSYFMNFTGESVVLDSACSSSMAALKYACNALNNGECEGAVVGGVQLNIFPDKSEYMIGIESLDGHTYSFDKDSDGTGISEGVSTIIVKRLDDAVRDKDHIYGVIQAVNSNQDGLSMGFSAPNPRAQTELVHNAVRELEIFTDQISYMELHGTGTKLGDAIELQALEQALAQSEGEENKIIPIGSVKANIGHTFACSGIAGLIKCCLMVETKKICPQINYDAPADERMVKRFSISKTAVNLEEREQPHICCISNFGLSGTNYLSVITEYKKKRRGKKRPSTELFVLSSMNKGGLLRLVEDYKYYLMAHEEADLSEICYTAATGRGHHEYRLAIVCCSIRDLISKLEMFCCYSDPGKKIFYQYSKRIKDSRQSADFGSIDKVHIQKLSSEVKAVINDNQDFDDDLYRRIASCYVNGAEVGWENMYKKRKIYKINIPTYSFEKTKCWPE